MVKYLDKKLIKMNVRALNLVGNLLSFPKKMGLHPTPNRSFVMII